MTFPLLRVSLRSRLTVASRIARFAYDPLLASPFAHARPLPLRAVRSTLCGHTATVVADGRRAPSIVTVLAVLFAAVGRVIDDVSAGCPFLAAFGFCRHVSGLCLRRVASLAGG